MKAIRIEQFTNYHFLSNLQFSHCGKLLCFVETKSDLENNAYQQRLDCINVEDGSLHALSEYRKHVAYYTLQDGILIQKEGSAAHTSMFEWVRQDGMHDAFELPLIVNDVRDFDTEQYLIYATVNRKYSQYYALNEEERKKIDCEQKEDSDYIVLDEYPFVFNGAGLINGDRQTLFLMKKDGSDLHPITPETLDVESYDVKDGRIVLSGVDFTTCKGKWAWIYEYDGKQLNTVFDQKCQIERVWYENDQICAAANFAKEYGAMEYSKFYVLKDGELELQIPFEHSLYNTIGTDVHYGKVHQFAKDGDVPYFMGTLEGKGVLYCKKDDRMEMVIDTIGSVDDFAVHQGKIYIIGMKDQSLQEIYAYKDGQLEKVTSINSEYLKDCYVAEPEPLNLNKPTMIQGWVLKPKDYDPAQKYPMILDIHGGPRCAYGSVYYHEMQVWAGMGYFVIFCNPRGSDGRDNAFMDLRKNYGTPDYEDLMDFVDLALETYPSIDPQRLAVTGGSYGGYMTNWIIGHTQRFKAAATQRSISNWITEVTASDYGLDFPIEQEYDDIYHAEEELWDVSPLKYSNNVTTPTLFIHSLEDYRCPVWEGLQLYTVLKLRSVETKMVLFKGENHELSRSGKPKHRIRRLQEITEWMEKHLKEEQ